ncbi:hypothetical protein B0H67DRAFT_567578 [Lasiosphaeris hirsuta]|uniref:RBR-type E3 ubiquitin transferase n=1 Tax=Lasiosphaeris hirsuta TaxID=260670 RepID=A0AA40AYC9_9PEZI|nr:hypothetical protein B0H67DRAFT_567578 [Lasiosphaeris hirsuta]
MSRLRRSISSVLRGKKPADVPMSGALPAVPELPTLNNPLNNEDDEFIDEQALQQAFVESLREQTRALEQEHSAEKAARQRVEQSLRVKTAEVDGLLLKVQAARQGEENRERIRQLEASIHDIGEEKKRLEKNVVEGVLQFSELEASLKEYQIWSVKSAEEHTAKDAVIATLEAEKEDLARLVGISEPVVRLQKEKSQLQERVKVLQAEVVHSRAEGEGTARALEKVRLQNQELRGWVATLNQEMENAEAQMREIEASKVLDASLTPRILLVSKLLLGHARNGAQGGSDDPFLQSCLPSLLTSQKLDVQLNTNQAKTLMENLAVGELMILACDVCLLPKLTAKPDVARPRLRVDEFISTSRPTSCCSKSVCRQCFAQSLDESSSRDWWTNLGVASWLRCPVSSCEASLNIGFIAGFETLLCQLGGKDTARQLEMYERAEAFRAALSRRSPAFSNEALLVASSLQNHLVTIRRMHPLSDPMFTNRIPDETGRVPPFNPGKIRTVSVDHNGDNSIDVPLFIRFLRRQETPKSCIVCTDDFFDIHTGSAEEWLELCQGFHGAWMWDVLLSPIKLELECHHTIDFCTTCLQSHLTAQLEQHGRGAPGQLSCPSPDCGRKLSYQEIQLYGSRDTFIQYDKYLQLDALSRLPNFRWCLRPGCSSGQLYDDDDQLSDDDDDGPMDPHMYCDECGFEMCFVHSMPWHAGQSCAQYDSVRDHGDPEFQQTQDWIRNNTKPCPGCNENIQKGEYCFHMTCTRCRYEFCWECLADWRLIAPGNSTYNVGAHKAECPFRTNGLAPTQISGTNLQEALRRRRNGR